MSNPAVIKLQRKNIYHQDVWLDDNFGESIHLHIDNWRVDMTSDEFANMCNDICLSLNEMIDVEGFDSRNFSPIYLEQMLYKGFSYLTKVKIENVKLSDLVCPLPNEVYVPLSKSRCVRALNGDTRENDQPRTSNFEGQKGSERLSNVYTSIKENGYPYNNEYIILYNDENIIRDGQHRAACLYDISGDIEVPVMRLYFSKNEFYIHDTDKVTILDKIVSKIIHPKEGCDYIYNKLRLVKRKLVKIKRDYYYKSHKVDIDHIMEGFNSR